MLPRSDTSGTGLAASTLAGPLITRKGDVLRKRIDDWPFSIQDLLPKLEDSGDGVRSEAMCESLLPADLVGLHLRL